MNLISGPVLSIDRRGSEMLYSRSIYLNDSWKGKGVKGQRLFRISQLSFIVVRLTRV